LETIPDGVDPAAYKHCMEYCQAQGVNLDTFKFIGIGLDKLRIMPKKPELKLSKYIDDAFVVPDAEAQCFHDLQGSCVLTLLCKFVLNFLF
jgi:hypothetical protein